MTHLVDLHQITKLEESVVAVNYLAIMNYWNPSLSYLSLVALITGGPRLLGSALSLR